MADKLLPKNIPEQKLKAFSIGTMGKRTMSKREMEELRRKEQEEAAAHAFQEFVETFQETPLNGTSKIWVKAGTYDAGARKEDTKDKGKIYKPQSRISASVQENLSSAERAQEYARILANERKPERLGKKKTKDKSNLELFKEELRQIQEEREERHKYKGTVKSIDPEFDILIKPGETGSFDNGDPTTTNLYLGNLNPKITEQQLMEIFGKFGPLASIKIMWPRSDEEKARGRNCGFVAYMNRKDGERALRNLNGKDIMNYEMKLGWGKSVIIPPHPIYIPPSLLELSLPPPPSGLPFNAQPCGRLKPDDIDKVLKQAVVKVVIPTDRNVLMLIHRMVEFVIREGPLFEAMIMNREINSPLFRFLFENQSPAHIYYRWKLFSMMQGDSQKEWNLKEFRMFLGGSVWKPPVMNVYTQGMPPDLIEDDAKELSKGSLSNAQRDRLIDLIRSLTLERRKIGEAMVFCIEHSEAADEIAEIMEACLSNPSTKIPKKVARLYLVSDILHNCGVKINNASHYRKAFEDRLLEIFKHLYEVYLNINGRLKAEGFKARIIKVLKAWEESAIYPRDFINYLHSTFLGVDEVKPPEDEADSRLEGFPLEEDTDFDDGVPMDGAALLKGVIKHNLRPTTPDLDGIPLTNVCSTLPQVSSDIYSEMDKKYLEETPSGFIPSKWETIDPDQVEAQAMTTSKWDQLEENEDNSDNSNQNDMQDSSDVSDARNLTEEKRLKLREIELKAIQYQDELESGQRTLKSGWTMPQQVEHYRRKLLRKCEKEKPVKEKDFAKPEKYKKDWSERTSRRSSSPDEVAQQFKDIIVSSSRRKKRSRSSSDSSPERKPRHKSHSKSPIRKSHRSRSPTITKKSRQLTPPTPPRIRPSAGSASISKSKRNRNSTSPASLKYELSPAPPARVSSKHRLLTPSPPPNKYTRGKSPSPLSSKKKFSTSDSRYKTQSPELTKKHRHKHRY